MIQVYFTILRQYLTFKLNQVSCQVYYVVKVVENFVESKAKIFRIAVAIVKIFNAAIGKIFKTWYDNNMLDMTLVTKIY